MRGIPEYNYPAFMKAAKDLRALGWTVYNPAEVDIKEDQVDYASRTIEEQKLYDTASAARRFARRDIDILLDILEEEKGDVIFVLPGWENSTGAQAEVALGKWVMLPIVPIGVIAEPPEGEDW
jgi:hypothetical protein